MEPPATAQSLGLGMPQESQLVNNPFGLGTPEADRLAMQILDEHRHGLANRRQHDLTCEKYLIHIDGEGSAQWAEIVDGMFIMVPPSLTNSLRLQRNLLRPLVENMVAYHTAIPYRCVVRTGHDKKSRDRARIDELYGNHVIVTQNLNGLSAAAMYLGAAFGHGLLHMQWRDDLIADDYEPLVSPDMMQQDPALAQQARPGFVDIWVGDPWATVYNAGATRWSQRWYSYNRVLPAEMVRQAFAHVPGIENLTGRTDLPSASRFQRTIRRWTPGGYGHGTAAQLGTRAGEELVAIVVKNELPGVDPDYPQGCLKIIGVKGISEVDGYREGSSMGQAMLLHKAPLPAGRPDAVRLYAGHRSDDILGAPYVKDLDDLQVQLNQLVTMRTEFLRKFAYPPLVAQAGSLEDESVVTNDDAIIYNHGQQMPQFLYPNATGMQHFNEAIAETLEQLFRIGGWQAASRGEANAGDPAAKVVALARADDTIFGPINREFQHSICEVLQTCQALARRYMSAPMVVKLIGEEWGHLAEPWIKPGQLSSELPTYELAQGFGSTPEAKAEQLFGLVQAIGADQQPLLSVDQFWQMYPDQSVRPPEQSARRTREVRAQVINRALEETAENYKLMYADQYLLPQYMQEAWFDFQQRYRLLRTDDPRLHQEVLDLIVQDEYADPLARQLATWRQDLYANFQNAIAMQQGQMQQAMAGPAEGGQPTGALPPGRDVSALAAQGGTPTSDNMASAEDEVSALTQDASKGIL